MQAIKETASNIGASAKSGMDKTVAVVEEKIEKMKAHDPVQKAVATEKKEERIARAEWEKHAAQEHNAAAKQNNNAGGAAADADGGYGSSGLDTASSDYGKTGMQSHAHSVNEESGHVMGGYEMSAISGRKTEQIYHESMADGANKIHPRERTDNAVYGSGNNKH